MASQGPLSPGTLSQDINGGNAWTNEANAGTSDNVYTTCTMGSGLESDYLIATNFGFSIPTGATIDGIVAEVESHVNADQVASITAQVMRSGVAVGEQGASPGPSTSDAYSIAGASNSLWGTTWTVAQINDSSFGVQLWFTDQAGVGVNVSVDHIRITVYYTDASGQPSVKRMGGVQGAFGGPQHGSGIRRW